MRLRVVLLAATAAGASLAEERVDLNAVHRIKAEAFDRSQVMDTAFHLTDLHGPRLTNSPGFHAAADWTVSKLKEWGLASVSKEKWGPFGRGWSYSRFSAHIVEPAATQLIGFPLAWTPGTEGAVRGEPVLAPLKTQKDFEKFKGKLKGKIVLIDDPRATAAQMTPPGRRWTEAELNERFLWAPTPPRQSSNTEEARKFRGDRNKFLREEGAVAVLSAGYRGDGGTVFASYGGSYDAKYPDPPPMAAITPEHYNRVTRLLDKKIPVKIEIDIRAQYESEGADSYNIIAELPGHSKKDEVVMLGAHFDSWHGGTGATDNAAGSAVMMEAMRILKALDLKPARTVRLALWSGEEQGLLGSKAYVKKHFADPETMELKPEHARLAGYFNYDNGTGKIRGIYLQQNDMLRPVFAAWLEPFRDMGATTVSIRNTSGTDHLPFNAVGLPGFQFIQDPVEYENRTHHSNMDTYDRLQADDLKQASAIIASFVWNAATRPEMLARKPLPQPEPKKKEEPKKENVSGN